MPDSHVQFSCICCIVKFMKQMIGVDMSLSMLCKTMFLFFLHEKKKKENKKSKRRKSPFIVQLFSVSLTGFDWNTRLCCLMFILYQGYFGKVDRCISMMLNDRE